LVDVAFQVHKLSWVDFDFPFGFNHFIACNGASGF
jgi:hypothetical protein